MAFSRFDPHYIDTQHLACERSVHNPGNDLLAIRSDLAIVDLPIIPVRHSDDYSCACRHGDSFLEILLVNGVADGSGAV